MSKKDLIIGVIYVSAVTFLGYLLDYPLEFGLMGVGLYMIYILDKNGLLK